MKRFRLVAIVGAVLLLIALFSTLRGWSAEGPLERDITVQIPQGASLASAADRLEEAGVIGSASRFRLRARLFGSGEPIKAGEFQIPARISQSDLLGLLQGGKVLQRMVVVPEGYPSVLVHDALMRADGLEGQAPVPAEGSVLPDSYSFERGDQRSEVVARMQKAMRDYLAQAWPKRQPNSVVKTPQELVTLASIVEKETGKPSERRMVAAVYSNRLRIGMKLDADPTVIYPITRGRPLGRRILRSELNAKNGYNTYASPGLPVGPIANPGRESIDAVLNPAESKALYFVADGTGGHVFANTLAEHNANVRKWYAIRRARGEM
ncbi:endolytic transglycosylase MltG [Sphingomonas lenta]|uniref:Endolytic murein transglycosylase n=1 Tax=Sphingomonas lenta TaxID=1141887 RepID=A0A2A2SKK2_9SPHN|nr:endolytic transglycosylase MltG [Sphingomonas lenta]PAX09541.1 aminodeoxychorismate lyase [Sphingomonas lenta]